MFDAVQPGGASLARIVRVVELAAAPRPGSGTGAATGTGEDPDVVLALRGAGHADEAGHPVLEGVDLALRVGEGAHRLTATQEQMLALARVVLADPELVVLDEATAEAGSAGARELEAAASAVLAGRSALVVAHRLSQAASADRVLVMAGGRVVEDGTHDALRQGTGPYAELWRAWTAR